MDYGRAAVPDGTSVHGASGQRATRWCGPSDGHSESAGGESAAQWPARHGGAPAGQLTTWRPRATAGGHAAFQHGGNVRRLRIDYTEPQSKTVVVNGNEAILIEPALNQAFVSTTNEIAKKTASTSLLTVLTDARQLSENFDVALEGEETLDGQPTTKLLLRPKSKSQYTRLEVWVSHQNWLPVKQVLHTRSDYTTILLSNIRLQSIPESSFKVDYSKYKVIRG